jgi:Fe-S-cluster containining protein
VAEARKIVQRKNSITPINPAVDAGVPHSYARRVAYHFPASADQKLIQIVDAALADTTRRSGKWLVCRPGCTQCCIGAFAINQLDAMRLQRGLLQLERQDPARASAIRRRAKEAVARLSADFPGDPRTGILDESEHATARFEIFANDEPCPVLDPETGNCELYGSRPMTCRVFGPPVRSEDGLGVCELCFQGATEEEIAACEMKPDPDDLESRVLNNVEQGSGVRGQTIIAFCLAD